MRPVIQFYMESSVSTRRMLEGTARQSGEKISRFLDQLERDYGVRVGDDAITGLTPVVLQRWFNAVSPAWKPGTANNYICVLNPFLRWAHKMEYMEKDLSGVLHVARLPDVSELPDDQKPKDKYYTHQQAHDLMYNAKGTRNILRDRAIIGMILYGGFRVSEICALTIGQVMDVPRGSVRLRRKGGAWCDQPINPAVYPLLDAYLATRKDTANREAPLFMTSHGNPCNRKQIYYALRSKQEQFGLATGPHALRHTAISEVANTFGAAAARDFANHKSLVVTNRYTHTTPEQRRDAVNGLAW